MTNDAGANFLLGVVELLQAHGWRYAGPPDGHGRRMLTGPMSPGDLLTPPGHLPVTFATALDLTIAKMLNDRPELER